jgi:formate dehydrogenase major subunit
MGSNMAEQHPVGFQWVMEAKERGAKLVHVDPRFTRTSAMADLHVPLRSGTDIVFLGGVIRYILENGREFRKYVQHYTNARSIISDEFRDTEDLDGLFSGWVPEDNAYEPGSWGYKGAESEPTAGAKEQKGDVSGDQAHGAHGAGMPLPGGEAPETDWDLEDPQCVFQITRRHFARYTPEMVAEVCGVPEELFLQVAEALCANSGPERTSAICYAVGWTQHTTGVQNIRAAAIIQLLLGNIGRPGGGIMALRGHANIQGSTDIPTLFDILPGYIPMPHPNESGFDEWVEKSAPKDGVWSSARSYMVSLQKAWWGDAATEENGWAYAYLPRIDDDHSHYTMCLRMIDGATRGFIVMGQNPVVGSANSALQRKALNAIDWLVVRDTSEIETAAWWHDSPEIEAGEITPEEIGTEVFFLPAATHVEKEGTFTNTQRLLQWHHKAVEPPGDCRSENWFAYHLLRKVRERLAGSTDPKDRPILDLVWDYRSGPPTPDDEPDAAMILQEINGRRADGSFVSRYQELKDDGSTTCGSWIHAGIHADGVNQSARKKPGSEQNWIAPEWGWAWPSNRRILYNRASADPDGKPWSERKKYVWWDAQEGRWTSLGDDPDFEPTKPPDYTPSREATGMDAIAGDNPFILHPDGLGWIYAQTGLVDGPLPTHYEPQESPFANRLYGQRENPTRQCFDRTGNRYNPAGGAPGSEVFPFVMTTYRLTEHHTAGGMSRSVPYLSELQPEMFCEVSPELAAERGLEHGGWATIVTARTAIGARVMVTRRMQPLEVMGTPMHQVGLPYHWGRRGLVKGDAANELLPLVLDQNVHISEFKTSTCDIVAGRRPRGPALRELVDGYRRRAGVEGA